MSTSCQPRHLNSNRIHEVEVDQKQLDTPLPPVPGLCDHNICGGSCWRDYPKSRFPNWTDSQVERSGIAAAIREHNGTSPCTIYHVDIDERGKFMDREKLSTKEINNDELWQVIIEAQVGMDFVLRYLGHALTRF